MGEVAKLMTPEMDLLQLYDAATVKLRCDNTAMYVDRRMEEYMFLGLRMIRGVSRTEFKEKFNKEMFDVYGPVINKYVDDGFLKLEEDRVALTDAGIDISNIILSEFLLDH